MLALGVSGWSYYTWRLKDVAPFPPAPPRNPRAVAVIMAAPQSPAASGTPAAGEEPPPAGPERIHVDPGRDPMRKFYEDLNRDLSENALREIRPSFPEISSLLPGKEGDFDARYLEAVSRLLDGLDKAPVEQRPAILFAANLAAEHLACFGSYEERAAKCAPVQKELAKHGLALRHDELGGGMYYTSDLLWRIWQEYPQTTWGERVFVLLLERGWDTSGTCDKGGDQTREVIRQGETFLAERPQSPCRDAVTLLVGQAYASRWSMSAPPSGAMGDYIDPKDFKEGAEEARSKAIGYFEQIQNAPENQLGEYAREVLLGLRKQHVLENPSFFCVYD